MREPFATKHDIAAAIIVLALVGLAFYVGNETPLVALLIGLLAGYVAMAARLQRSHEAEVRKTAQIEGLIESLPVGIALIDAENGGVVTANTKTAEMIGLSPETWRAELTQKGRFGFRAVRKDGTPYPPEEFPLTSTLRDGTSSVKNDVFAVRPDGTLIGLRVWSAPVKTPDGRLHSAVVILEDYAREQGLERAKDEFISVASHQLKTPTVSLKWYLELLLAGDVGKVPRGQKEYLEDMHRISKGMIELVNSLLNVSRIDLGLYSVQPVPTDIVEVAERSLAELAPEAKRKRLEVKKIYEPGLPQVNADPQVMRVIVQNLLSNAIKYTPEEGRVTLHVTDGDGFLHIDVADSGVGIPADQQAKIFNKFFRASNVLSGFEGSGLGLYAVKEIVEAAGGDISFESVEGKGTTFHVRFPLAGMKAKSGTRALDVIV